MDDKLESLANFWKMAWNNHAMSRWRWCRRLVEFMDENPKYSAKQIGVACAKAVQRDKPYAASWILHQVKAGRQFPEEPKGEMERRKFNACVQGRKELRPTMSLARSQGINSPERCRSMAVAFARKAVRLGVSLDEIFDLIRAAVLEEKSEKTTKKRAA